MSQLLLSEQERTYLVSILQELDPSAPKEKRSSIRRKVQLHVSIRLLGKGAPQLPQKVTLSNVSRKGLAIHTPSTPSVGEYFVAPLEFSDAEGKREGGWLVLCQVKNVRQLPSGLFKAGTQFIDRIDDPDGTADIPKSWLTKE